MNILILCAGYGTRLKPLTDTLPKPLVPILNKPILAYHLEQCEKISHDLLCVNAHHLAEQLQSWAKGKAIRKIFFEPSILGTGGPLHRMVEESFTDELLVINSDIFHNIHLEEFVTQSRSSGSAFTLLTLDRMAVNTLSLDSQNRVVGIDHRYTSGSPARKMTYGGIAWYSPQALRSISSDHLDIRNFWQDQANRNIFPLAIEKPDNNFWFDIGSPRDLFEASFFARDHSGVPEKPERIFPGVKITDSIIGRDAVIVSGTGLDRCLVLDGAQILLPAFFEHSIIGKDFIWKIPKN